MEEQPLDLSMAGTKKTKTMNTPKAELIIESLYKTGHRLYDNFGNKYSFKSFNQWKMIE